MKNNSWLHLIGFTALLISITITEVQAHSKTTTQVSPSFGKWPQKKLTLSLNGLSYCKTLKLLGDAVKSKIEAPHCHKRKAITLKLRNVPWVVILRNVVRMGGDVVRKAKNGYVVDIHRSNRRFTFVLKTSKYCNVLKMLANAARIKIKAPHCHKRKAITIRLRNTPWIKIFRSVVKMGGDRARKTRDGYVLSPQ